MATNFDPRSSTPHDLPFPLHRMNRPQTIMWLASETWRRNFCSVKLKTYRGGFGVLSATQYLIAKVDPRGNIQDLVEPFRRFEMWQIANRPEIEECPCAYFFDPEVGGEWRERDGKNGHHPLCQFDKSAVPVFKRAAGEAWNRIKEGHDPQARPDEWLRMREEAQGSLIIRSR
jgi:hypothetical protein